jgi:hypothetical protein
MATNFDIFIAHSHEDDAWTRQLTQALRARGLSVWLDDDEVKPGEEWGRKVREGLRKSSQIVFLVGAGIGKSPRLAAELGMALAERKRIISVVDPDVPSEEIPGPIRLRHYLKKGDPKIVAEEIADAVAA